MEHPPTARQRNLLEAVRKYIKERGYPPSQRDLSLLLGFKSSNAARECVIACERKGLLTSVPHIARSTTLTELGHFALDSGAVVRTEED